MYDGYYLYYYENTAEIFVIFYIAFYSFLLFHLYSD